MKKWVSIGLAGVVAAAGLAGAALASDEAVLAPLTNPAVVPLPGAVTIGTVPAAVPAGAAAGEAVAAAAITAAPAAGPASISRQSADAPRKLVRAHGQPARKRFRNPLPISIGVFR